LLALSKKIKNFDSFLCEIIALHVLFTYFQNFKIKRVFWGGNFILRYPSYSKIVNNATFEMDTWLEDSKEALFLHLVFKLWKDPFKVDFVGTNLNFLASHIIEKCIVVGFFLLFELNTLYKWSLTLCLISCKIQMTNNNFCITFFISRRV